MTASTRRTALGAILAAPLASVPPITAGSVSPALSRLIAEHDAQRPQIEHGGVVSKQAQKDGGRLRARVAAYPSRGWADTMAKAACLARLWPLPDAEEELQCQIGRDYAFLSDMALAIACEVMRHGETGSCV